MSLWKFKTMKHDLYIEILDYGRTNLGKAVKYSELLVHLTTKGYEYDEFSVGQFFTALYIDKGERRGNKPGSPREEGEFFLEHSGYFNLLQHEELVSARESASQAIWFASIAILVSILSMGASIFYSNLQLKTPTEISSDQLHTINTEFSNDIGELIGLTRKASNALSGIKVSLEKANNKPMEPIPSAPAD
jgi:hypothetical protein